ncbi:MAG: tRNA epoxyqueuosine(34) reductase QueG [Planctomycetes bacterium]|nr:tRNA epoxyqueuosine(34) reductase QueG [Planctomycetota bacterium]
MNFDEIKNVMRGLGIDRVGAASLEKAFREPEYREFLSRGFHGTMEYLERNLDVRNDPRIRFPWAKSAIVCALCYANELPPETPEDSVLRSVARYAHGSDYHDVFGGKLRTLVELLRAEGTEAHYYVDTGPVMEKELAERAGLGWIGKNTLVLDRRRGSYFFIGVVFTSLDLEPSLSATNHCGTCTKCLEACPTSAFPEPYKLDATKCISYLTIEHKPPLSEAARGASGSLIFGCDVCQEVCPYNRGVQVKAHEEFAPRKETLELTKKDVLELSAESFREHFRRTPVWRAKRRGFLYHTILSLPAELDEETATILGRIAEDEDDEILSGAAKWKLSQSSS